MKHTRLTLLTIALTVLISGGVFLALSKAATTVKANVAWDPKYYTWNGAPPNPWNAEVWLAGGHKAQVEIDPTTIQLEGQTVPYGTPYNSTHGPRLVIPFDGNYVKSALFYKLPTHLGILIPGTYHIQIIVSGTLKAAYGGTAWSGDGIIVATILSPP